jgi:hypothetical protein
VLDNKTSFISIFNTIKKTFHNRHKKFAKLMAGLIHGLVKLFSIPLHPFKRPAALAGRRPSSWLESGGGLKSESSLLRFMIQQVLVSSAHGWPKQKEAK